MTTTVEILAKSPFSNESFVFDKRNIDPGETRTLGWKVYSGNPDDETLMSLEVTNIQDMRTIIKVGEHTDILEDHNDYRDYCAKSLLPKGETIFRVIHTVPNLHIKPAC